MHHRSGSIPLRKGLLYMLSLQSDSTVTPVCNATYAQGSCLLGVQRLAVVTHTAAGHCFL